MTATAIIGVDADTGKLLWRFRHVNKYKENCEMPLYRDGLLYVSSGYKRGSDMLKLTYDQKKVSVDQVWTSKRADNLHDGPIWHEGYIYGVGYDYTGWFCLDVRTGEIKYQTRKVRRGCLTFAEGFLYCLDNRGRMSLIEPSPEEFKLLSQFRVPKDAGGLFLAHPVVCGGRLYGRHADNLYAYEIERQ